MMLRRFPHGTAALVVPTALLCACSGGDVRARGATVAYDTVGDTIIARVDGPAVWGEVTLEEEVRIGELEGADEYTLGSVVSLAVDGAGNIYALDRQALTVRKYDANGQHVQSIGRSGSGPGELKQPQGLDFLPDGRLAVRDFGNARINLYDEAGESTGTLIIPGGFSTSTPMQIDTAGRIYTSVTTDRAEGLFRVGFQRFDAQGNVQDTIRHPQPDFQAAQLVARSPDGSGTSSTIVPFTPAVSWTLDRVGNVVWGITSDYAIHTVRDGRPFRITRVVEPITVQSAEKAVSKENVERNMRQTQPAWSWNGPGIPDTKPFFRSLTVAHDGRIWVQVTQPAVRLPPDTTAARAPDAPPPLERWVEPMVYDVFEPDGRWLGRVALPERFRAMYMRGYHIWGVQRDEYDVNYVTRLRIAH